MPQIAVFSFLARSQAQQQLSHFIKRPMANSPECSNDLNLFFKTPYTERTRMHCMVVLHGLQQVENWNAHTLKIDRYSGVAFGFWKVQDALYRSLFHAKEKYPCY